jgi:hypothetical protein
MHSEHLEERGPTTHFRRASPAETFAVRQPLQGAISVPFCSMSRTRFFRRVVELFDLRRGVVGIMEDIVEIRKQRKKTLGSL